MKKGEVAISQTIKGKLPRLPFLEMKQYCLGASFTVSIVFVGETRARALNTMYRGKSYVPNILTFPLSKESGEIVICLSQARRDAKKFSMKKSEFLHYLLIHGFFHLKGMAHGSKMNVQERRARKKFSVPEAQ
ncbi:MAG: rRNA maturation RNase YbeY [Patescibacteria group bacterium]